MHFNNIASSALALCTLIPAALGVPTVMVEEGNSARSQDMTVKWYPYTTCSTSGDPGGPERSYSRNVCLPLTETDHGVEILDRYGACHMVAYNSGTCDGGEKNLDTLGCWSLEGKWSVMIKC